MTFWLGVLSGAVHHMTLAATSLVLALTAIALVVSAKSDLRKAQKLNKKRGMTPYE